MLGWQVSINQESDTLIASWCVGIGGLDWLDESCHSVQERL
jgi:hypothetical protein